MNRAEDRVPGKGEGGTPVTRLAAHLSASLEPRHTVYLIPHDHPDPDALASAAALGILLRYLGLRGRIVFSGDITRAENRELLRHIRFPWRKGLPIRRRPAPVVLVDTTPWSGNVTLPAWARPVAVVDHHVAGARRRRPAMELIVVHDARVGATATLAYRELKAHGIRPAPWLATALVYAIVSETMDLSREFTPEDLGSYLELLPSCNLRLLGRVRHAPLPRQYYGWMRRALENAYTYGRVAWANLSEVDAPEVLAEVADLLLRMERITWAFCTAVTGRTVLVSLRSAQRQARCARVLRGVIEAVGGGSTGGHDQMAGGRIVLEGRDPESVRLALVEALVRRIERGRTDPAPGAVLGAAQPLAG